MAGAVAACSLVTHDEIKIYIPHEEPTACPECGCVPGWDARGDLTCYCKTWAGPNAGKETYRQQNVDVEILKEQRNANYQRDMHRFFRKGGRG